MWNTSSFDLTICMQLSASRLGMSLHGAGSPGEIYKLLVDEDKPKHVHCMIGGTECIL